MRASPGADVVRAPGDLPEKLIVNHSRTDHLKLALPPMLAHLQPPAAAQRVPHWQ
jgi:hypothetical protein